MPQAELTELGESRLIGPPGTGKTTFLAGQIAFDAREHGSDAVMALSHTNAAAFEIASRDVPLPRENIGTLHSFAYRSLGRPLLLQTQEGLEGFNRTCPQYAMSGGANPERIEAQEITMKEPGDAVMQQYQRLRNMCAPREIWPQEVQTFARLWEQYKTDQDGIDFTDMISLALEESACAPGAPEVIIADETQDLSRLQLQLLWKWAGAADKVIMALDPDQSIYGFSGADPRIFLEKRPARQKVLAQSYRVPRAVHEWAMEWIGRNVHREQIEYRPRDFEGAVNQAPTIWKAPENILRSIEADLDAGRTVMILASCGYMLDPMAQVLKQEGFYFWNPYRRENGSWNPLPRSRKNAISTVQRVMSFLKPWCPGEEMWSGEDCACWLDLVKGILKRGAKVPATFGQELRISDLMALFKDVNEFDLMYREPAESLIWLRDRLKSKYQKAGGYAVRVALKRGPETLLGDPPITLGSIHSVKGGEADSVYIFPDLSFQGYEQWSTETGREATRRLFYVAATRAKERLTLCAPCGPLAVQW